MHSTKYTPLTTHHYLPIRIRKQIIKVFIKQRKKTRQNPLKKNTHPKIKKPRSKKKRYFHILTNT
ncbi:MAG: hypothetical protein DRN08_04860 [Thermoplasmata archaeon]|nr:MAG: hypothetical protein DRN08_04860 [Thermoplasmata archaeon]